MKLMKVFDKYTDEISIILQIANTADIRHVCPVA
jgi:hypothetical protein